MRRAFTAILGSVSMPYWRDVEIWIDECQVKKISKIAMRSVEDNVAQAQDFIDNLMERTSALVLHRL